MSGRPKTRKKDPKRTGEKIKLVRLFESTTVRLKLLGATSRNVSYDDVVNQLVDEYERTHRRISRLGVRTRKEEKEIEDGNLWVEK